MAAAKEGIASARLWDARALREREPPARPGRRPPGLPLSPPSRGVVDRAPYRVSERAASAPVLQVA